MPGVHKVVPVNFVAQFKGKSSQWERLECFEVLMTFGCFHGRVGRDHVF